MGEDLGDLEETTVPGRNPCASACIDCAELEALRRDRSKLEAAQALAHVGCWEIGLRDRARFADRTVSASAEMLRIFCVGHRPTSRELLSRVHPEDRGRVGLAFRAALAADRAPFECRIVRPDGELRFLRTNLEVQRDSLGRAQLLRGATFDITDTQRALDELRRHDAHMMMADRLASVGQLAAGVAHEINNLLSSVRGNLEVALNELASLCAPAGVTEPMQDAIVASDRVQQIVRDLKMLSRADEDDRTAVDVCAAVSSTVRLAVRQIQGRARLELDLQPVPDVHANQARLGQVVLNLVVNALQAIPEGNPAQATVRVSTRWTGSQIEIAVADTGVGIPESARPRLFEPFFTTKPSGVGTGLGLPICLQIVNGLGGTIEYDTTLGRGTTFRVLLPAIAPPARANVPADSLGAAAMYPGPRVLVVDDEVLVRRTVARILRGYEVTMVGSAAEAAQLLLGGATFDLVLCDLMMPEMSGIELYTWMSREAPAGAARMRFMTGGACTDEAIGFLTEMAGRYIEKPFNAVTLRDAVGGWLAPPSALTDRAAPRR